MYHKRHSGFTLIELLVVISIIGLLSSIVLASLNGARIKNRNTMRKQHLVQLRTALELYYTQNGQYPITGPGVYYTSTPGGEGTYTDNGGNWIPGLVASGAIPVLPQDPLGGMSTNPSPYCSSSYRAYWYRGDTGRAYKVWSYCAAEGTSFSATDPFNDPYTGVAIPPGVSWVVCSDLITCQTL